METDIYGEGRRIGKNEWLVFNYQADRNGWRFDVIDRDSTLLRSAVIALDGNPSSISLAQNFGDPSVAILWGSSSGVKGTFLNYNLQSLAENVQISRTTDTVSNPVGFYRNDTLFVVWEDYRNGGVPNIYGTYVLTPKALSVKKERNGSAITGMLLARFDPTSESIVVEFDIPTREPVEIELFNLLGDRVDGLTALPGTRFARFNASGLPSGTYLVRARSDGMCCYQSISHVLR